jgi:hypothetical protein
MNASDQNKIKLTAKVKKTLAVLVSDFGVGDDDDAGSATCCILLFSSAAIRGRFRSAMR